VNPGIFVSPERANIVCLSLCLLMTPKFTPPSRIED
jgi:hypothetical protein